MRGYAPILIAVLFTACADVVQVGPVKIPVSSPDRVPTMTTFFDLKAVDIHGDTVEMARYKGKKILVVNVASECGNTPQYAQLQELYTTYKDRGLVIIGFPSNDFGGQEPGTEVQIEQFCQKNYGVTFPMMAKVATKGPTQAPIYQWLTQKSLNGKLDTEVTWNFQKYLVDEEGHLVTTVAPGTEPTTPVIMEWIEGKR